MIALFLFGLALAVEEKKQQAEHKPDIAPPQHALPVFSPDQNVPAPAPNHNSPALAPGHIVQALPAHHKAAATPAPIRRPKPTIITTAKRPTKEPHQAAKKIGSKTPGNFSFKLTKLSL